MKIAVVHDWLTVYGGAERVLEQIIRIYPDADLYSTIDFLPKNERNFILNKSVNTSFIQKLPFASKKYRSYLPLMPYAVEQFDLSDYDMVISSSASVAKGVLTGPDQLHICMCYSPIRYAWDLQHQYLTESGLDKGFKGILAKYFLHKMRIWDLRTANGVDEFIAISKYIARRIRKVYKRDSTIVYPPVYVDDFLPSTNNSETGDFYITASRMVPYKKIDLIVETFTQLLPNQKLVVIGDGPDMKKIKSKSNHNIDILGYQPYNVLKDYLQKGKAFIFAAEEDFGIAPLEAQASGTPVIAYGKGGALETVRGYGKDSHPTGIFFENQTPGSLANAIEWFEVNGNLIIRKDCINNAKLFSDKIFRKSFEEVIKNKYTKWKESF